jgi:short-subunit dehydrogenase
MQLSGARVVVTGASRGLGAALARRAARRGARLALVARSAPEIEALADELGGDAYPADLAVTAGLGDLVERIAADGPIDVFVNNAGVDLTGALVDLPPEKIEALILVNLVAPMLLCRAVIPGMLERGRGQLVNISSLSGTNALPVSRPIRHRKPASATSPRRCAPSSRARRSRRRSRSSARSRAR